MLNHITIMGRLTRDPELRYTQSGTAVASYTVAVDRDYAGQNQERGVDFIDCVAWRQGGEFVNNYFRKGQMIVVDGRLQSRKWQDRDGNNRIAREIIADHNYFGEPKRDEGRQQYGGYSQQQYGGYQQNAYQQPPMREMDGAGDGNPFVGQEGQARQAAQYSGQQAGMWDQLNDEADGELPF